MPRRLKAVPGMPEERASHEPFSVVELRAMLAEAESREQLEVERLRLELELLRAERTQAAVSTARSLPPQCFNVAEAATALRVSEPTIRSWVKTGKLGARQTKKRGRILIPHDVLLAMLSSPDSV
jgi:excisionase family DNA binding protein